MVFVLYTFGGWNEAAYVAGELRHERRNMLWVLLGSIALITVLYLAINMAYLRVLGVKGMAGSTAVAADTMQQAVGTSGRVAVTVLVAVSALGALDGCIFTGSRAISALGHDYALFRSLGKWHGRFRTPANAMGVQSAIAAVLILLPGLGARASKTFGKGFDTAVEYTAPAFWAFFLLTGISVFVLRVKDRHAPRPFRVPLFPVTVTLFCLMSAWMLYRSLDYKLGGAMVGVCVLLAGVPVYLLCRRRSG
jgi:amino acid transporter